MYEQCSLITVETQYIVYCHAWDKAIYIEILVILHFLCSLYKDTIFLEESFWLKQVT